MPGQRFLFQCHRQIRSRMRVELARLATNVPGIHMQFIKILESGNPRRAEEY
jgi:hypothetical protein